MSIAFSVAQEINIQIEDRAKSTRFLSTIYGDFAPAIADPRLTLRVQVSDRPRASLAIRLGLDASYEPGRLLVRSGHYFERRGDELTVLVPTRVKRGRVPFARAVPGRHLSDEIVEPILGYMLRELGKTFVHASSYLDGGNGAQRATVLLAWRNTGKTNAILPRLRDNTILSDDLAIIDERGLVHPYPRPIRAYAYNADKLPVPLHERLRFRLRGMVTPPWRPVAYLSYRDGAPCPPVPLGELRFLNYPAKEAVDAAQLAAIAEQVTDFELSHFDERRHLLTMANILRPARSTAEIVVAALQNSGTWTT